MIKIRNDDIAERTKSRMRSRKRWVGGRYWSRSEKLHAIWDWWPGKSQQESWIANNQLQR